MKNKALLLALLFIAFFMASHDIDAQCAMCKGAAEANIRQGGGDPVGLNNGILYMLSVPYLLVGSIGYWWWRNRRKDREQVADMTEEDFEHYD